MKAIHITDIHANSPYTLADRKNFALKREMRELWRAAVDVETLNAVYSGLMRRYACREDKIKAAVVKFQRDPLRLRSSRERLMDFERRKKILRRLRAKIERKLNGILDTRNRIYKDCTPLQRAERTQALLRIPPQEFSQFDSLTPDEQDVKLLELVEKYKNNKSPLLNMPGLLNPHTVGSQKEADGSKRRNILQWEMIDRLIYASMRPDRYQHIFFTKTVDVVARWGRKARQIRSDGRFAMVKVLIVLIMRLDVKASLRSGVFNPVTQEFAGLSRQEIGDLAGISVHSVKAALHNLVKTEILHPGKQPRDSYPGSSPDEPIKYKGKPVVRRFTMRLIAGLSLEDQHKAARSDDWRYPDLSPEQRQKLKEMELDGVELGIDVREELDAAAKAYAAANARAAIAQFTADSPF